MIELTAETIAELEAQRKIAALAGPDSRVEVPGHVFAALLAAAERLGELEALLVGAYAAREKAEARAEQAEAERERLAVAARLSAQDCDEIVDGALNTQLIADRCAKRLRRATATDAARALD